MDMDNIHKIFRIALLIQKSLVHHYYLTANKFPIRVPQFEHIDLWLSICISK